VAAPKAAATPAPKPKPAAPPVVAAPNARGGWRIQLGAFAQRATAEALFARLRGKVGGRQAYYVTAGKVIRLQVGPYDSRAAATAACAGLGACFVVPGR
jgi:cell division septation protein DedD